MKKILLISYYWAPAGGAGVQRWLNFSNYFSSNNIDVTVISPKNGDYPNTDYSLIKTINPKIKQVKTFTPKLNSLFKIFAKKNEKVPFGSLQANKNDSLAKKIMLFLRLNLVVPDARVVWVPFALASAIKLCKKNNYDAVITTGPPHSSHLVGYFLKKIFNIKHIADFRDPWTDIYYLKTANRWAITNAFDRFLEKLIKKNSNKITVASYAWAKNLKTKKAVTITNGFTKTKFDNIEFNKSNIFRIKYIGKIINQNHLQKLVDYVLEAKKTYNFENIEITIIGDKLQKAVNICQKDFVEHKKAIAEMVNCELLLLCVNDYENNDGWLPIKLFEYIGSKTPILACGNTKGDAAQVIAKAKSGKIFEYEQKKECVNFVHELYKSWQKNSCTKICNNNTEFSFENKAAQMLSLIINNKS